MAMLLVHAYAARTTPATQLLRGTAGAARLYAAGSEELDVVVIGGGPGGYVASIKAGQLGLKTACVEGRGAMGGTCLNVGCIPSKALLNSSHKYHDAVHSFAHYGVIVENVKVDWAAMQKQKDAAVTGLTKGIEGLLKKNKVEYVKGWGKITGPNTVEVALSDGGSKTLTAKNILIATGSEVTPMNGLVIDEQKFVSSTGALVLKSIPKTMVVIGGGYIGLEMGSVYSRLGTKVTVVEFLDHVVPTMDGEIRRSFVRSLEKQGLKFRTGTKVTKGEVVGDKAVITLEPSKGGPAEQMEADVVLVSIGRRPLVKNLGLEEVGVVLDERGRIKVDDHFKTSVPSISAIGDCIHGPMLAHKAEEDGVAAVETMAGKKGHVNYATVPSICYTHPEVAQVGITEEEAKKSGIKYKVGKFSMMANSRARAQDDAEGVVKFVADAATDKILGCHIMSPSAGELIHEVVVAMEYGASTEDLARTCHGHPTLSEAVKEAALAAAFGKAIHM
eukprot:CAMPEP_0119107506 /NCGR_PEP_ID=MMETSP1180-20130426/10608_1 /TAXON_ID=3052 ORGANISM="Chlamydomonas cf sp, Strain CCMP681" /NCGR_SAMPLE_ID=MMETSP1180 /ASSEMBLY_ACC=CAM_ASM_000741 /LENGTH=501 /DNA_ID=CAMNT_0007093007 /DNA_START=22 /DNA_END=1527 /DNA_ORIENTATION=+